MNVFNLILLLLLIMDSNSYVRPKLGGAQKKRKALFSTRKRGKRRTQVHEKKAKPTAIRPAASEPAVSVIDER